MMISNRFLILTFCFITIFFNIAAISAVHEVTVERSEQEEEKMTIFYDHNGLAELVHQGGKVSASGVYGVWLWAKDGAKVHLELADEKFSPTHTGAPPASPRMRGERGGGKLSWAKVGEVALEKDQEFKANIQIEGRHSYFDYRPEAVGQMVLSLNPQFNPALSFELMRTLGDSPGPVDDCRITEIRHGDMTYILPEYKTKEEWLAQAKEYRYHILVSNGLWPMPEKTPLNAKIFGKVEYEDYTIEKVYFESYPGFLVTGNLYRPKGKEGPFPGIANPHGHWSNGRLENSDGGSIPGRCINFAKQGIVAFAYDMVGYNDSTQVPHDFREDTAALWGINLMALQLWNSIRVVDFLQSLPDVDSERIGCTGASGGGTQTFMLMAVDDRVKVAAPVNMISAHFQGGCNCENAHNLRLDMYNVEIGAMMAPRPLLLISATGDWTANTPQVEYPDIRSIYKLFGAEDKVHSVQIDSPHNYNKDSREPVYAWFGKWFLGIDDPEKFKEQPFDIPPKGDMLVFQYVEHPFVPTKSGGRPEPEVDTKAVVNYIISSSEKRLNALKPKDQESLERFRETMEISLRHSLAAEYPMTDDIVVESMGATKRSNFTAERLLIRRKNKGDKIPAILYIPAELSEKATGTLIVHENGKAALVDAANVTPGDLVAGLLKQGQAVLAIDCFLTGEYNTPFAQTKRNEDVRYFTTFNRTDTALRVQDILTGLAYLKSRAEVSSINLVGLGKAGLWSLLARSLAQDVARIAVDVAEFDNDNDDLFVSELFVPSLRRAGDFRTAGALIAPAELFIHNTGSLFNTVWTTDVYKAIGAESKLVVQKEKATEAKMVEWLAE